MPILSLTHAEAVERAALLHVESYDVTLDLTGLLDGQTLRSVSTIAFDATVGAATFVDCAATPLAITLNGVPLDPASATDGRIPLTDLREHNTLVVEATQQTADVTDYLRRTVDASDQRVYVWLSLEADGAKHLWACFDQPDLKAVWRFTALVPDSWTALSHGAPVSDDSDGTTRTIVFGETPRLSSYNTVVNAGPFHTVRREAGGFDLGLHCRHSLVPALERDLDEILEVIDHGLRWFGEKFRRPFAQRRYDHVFVPDLGGAMENWGCVTITDALLYPATTTALDSSQRAEIILHEMAHMWFGNLVTMRWWDDLWLNEAFASWASYWAQAAMPRYPVVWAIANLAEKQSAYVQDLGPASHPIRAVVADVDHAMANFDSITYCKGLSVLHQLYAYIGEDAFLTGLAEYFDAHAWANATLEDLMASFGRAAGRDLSSWTARWLDRGGPDTIALEGGTLTVTSADGSTPRPHRLDIASFDDAGTLIATMPVILEEPTATVALPTAAAHLLNASDVDYAVTASDAASTAWLAENAGRLPDPLSRALACTEAYLRVYQGEVAPAVYLGVVGSVLETERNPALVEEIVGGIWGFIGGWVRPDRTEAEFARFADVLVPLTDLPELRPSVLKALARCARTEAHFATIDRYAADDLPIAWRVLARRAELDRYDEGEVAALLQRDPDPEAWAYAAAVRAARPDADAKAEAWRQLAVDRDIPIGNAYGVVAMSFFAHGQATLLAPYGDRYLDMVRDLGSSAVTAAAYAGYLYPARVADEEFLAKAEALAASAEAAPAIAQVLVRLNDRRRRQLRAHRL